MINLWLALQFAAQVHAAALTPSGLTAELGLVSAEGRWEYRRLGCEGQPAKIRALSPEEVNELGGLISGLEALAPEARERAIVAILEKPVRAEGLPPDQFLWFKKSGNGLAATDCGKSAVPGCALGDPWAWRFEKHGEASAGAEAGRFGRELEVKLPSPAQIDFDLSGAPALAPEPAAAFPLDEPAAPRGRRIELDFAWGTRPRTDANARNLNTVFNLYGHGKDAFNEMILGDEAGSGFGVLLRAGEASVDIVLATLSSLFRHERGHMEHAEMAGASAHWVREDPDEGGSMNVTRHTPQIHNAGLSQAERKAHIAGGVNAMESAVAWRRTQIFEGDEISWTHSPQWLVDKMNFITYALDNPEPSDARSRSDHHGGNDMVRYSENHGKATGQDPDKVHERIVSAALWSALFDPTNYLVPKAYVYDYIVRGKGSIDNPMPEVLGRQWWMGTGAHLSEVGVFYTLDILSRSPQNGELLTVSSKLGEDSQGGLGAVYSNFKLAGDWLLARAGFEVWRQREAAAEGPKRLGGAVMAGVKVPLSEGVGLSLDLGWKDKGEMLDQGHDRGFFGTAGTQLGF